MMRDMNPLVVGGVVGCACAVGVIVLLSPYMLQVAAGWYILMALELGGIGLLGGMTVALLLWDRWYNRGPYDPH